MLKRATGRFLSPTFIGIELEGKNAFTLQLGRLHFDINKRFSKAKLKAMMMLTDYLTGVSVFSPTGEALSASEMNLDLNPRDPTLCPDSYPQCKSTPVKSGC